MKAIGSFLLGIALLAVGIIMFMSNVTVSGLGFYSLRLFSMGISTGPILLILLAILFVGYFITGKKVCLWLCLLTILALVICLIMGTRFYIRTMSALELGIIIGVMAAGLGLFIRGIFNLH